jgi:LPXTG-site transpeptidase (sortase) family protein
VFRRRLSTVLLVAGAVLLAVSLGQYGFMMWRQHQLRREWNSINTPGASGVQPVSLRANAAGMRLLIPSLHLDDVVVRGTNYEDLLVAPGWLDGSPPPGQGNTVIAGHRDTFFRHVADLEIGDAIELDRGGRAYQYKVKSRQIVQPTDTWVLANTPQPQLTLVTCYPTYWIGPAPERLIVQAALMRPSGQ